MLNDKFFISDKVEEGQVEMGDRSIETLHFKHLPNTAFERYFLWVNSKDEDVVVNASLRLLVMGLCEPDGKPAIDLETAARIKRPIMLNMVSKLLEINGYGQKAAPEGNA